MITRDSASKPASAKGLSDYDVQVKSGGEWQTVAEVRNNTQEMIRSAFDPVTTTAVRIYITGANDSYSRILELEVYGASG